MTAQGGRPTRRAFCVGGLMAVAGAGAIVAQPRRLENAGSARVLDRVIPTRIGEWHGNAAIDLILPEEDSIDQRIYNDQLARNYRAPGLPDIMLLIAHSTKVFWAESVHSPQVCYPAAGFTVSPARYSDWRIAPGVTMPGQVMSADRDDRHEQVGFWRRISNSVPRSWSEERLLLVRRNLAGVIPDGVLVRMSTIDADATRGQQAIRHFAAALIASCGAPTRDLLLGTDLSRRIRPG